MKVLICLNQFYISQLWKARVLRIQVSNIICYLSY